MFRAYLAPERGPERQPPYLAGGQVQLYNHEPKANERLAALQGGVRGKGPYWPQAARQTRSICAYGLPRGAGRSKTDRTERTSIRNRGMAETQVPCAC